MPRPARVELGDGGAATVRLRHVADHDLSVEPAAQGADEIGTMGLALHDAIGGMRSAVVRMQTSPDEVRVTADGIDSFSGRLEDLASEAPSRAGSAAQSANVVSEEQNVTTEEIERNLMVAEESLIEIASSVILVAAASFQTTETVRTVCLSVADLGRVATELTQGVQKSTLTHP